MTMTNFENVLLSVNQWPNHTAHWHNVGAGRRVRQSWAYDAFRRAVKHGYIKPYVGAAQNTTTYIITDKGLEYLKSCGYEA